MNTQIIIFFIKTMICGLKVRNIKVILYSLELLYCSNNGELTLKLDGVYNKLRWNDTLSKKKVNVYSFYYETRT